jgi:hypothetical protein
MLRIQDVYPGSRIPDPIFSIQDPGYRVDKIPDPHQRIKVFLTRKTATKFSKLGSGKFIPDPGFRGQKSIGFRIRIRNTGLTDSSIEIAKRAKPSRKTLLNTNIPRFRN